MATTAKKTPAATKNTASATSKPATKKVVDKPTIAKTTAKSTAATSDKKSADKPATKVAVKKSATAKATPAESAPVTKTALKDTKETAQQPKTVAASPEHRYHMIATAAYFLAQGRGFAGGYEMQDWITAEQKIDAKLKP